MQAVNGHSHVNGNYQLSLKVINSFVVHSNDVLSVAWTGNLLASGSADKTIHVWKIIKKQNGHVELEEVDYSPITDHVYHVQALHFSPFGTYLCECSSDGIVAVWDTTSGKKIAKDNLPALTLSAARCCRMSPDSRLIAAGGDSDCVALWSFDRAGGMNLLMVFNGHEATITAVCFTHDSRLLLSGSTAGDIRIWSCYESRSQPLWIQRDAHDLGCTCIDIAPYKVDVPNGENAFHVATGGYDNNIKLWHLLCSSNSTACKLKPSGNTLSGHSGDICSVRFANQTKLLLSCSSDRTFFLWDPVKGCALKRVGPLTKYVRSCCFSSDDEFIMAGFSGGIVGFWRISTSGEDGDEHCISIVKSSTDKKLQLEFLDDFNVPEEFLCPITHELMKDPVVALDGISYERSAIEAWFRKHETSPQTNLVLPSRITVPNYNLKLLINKWIQLNKRTSDA